MMGFYHNSQALGFKCTLELSTLESRPLFATHFKLPHSRLDFGELHKQNCAIVLAGNGGYSGAAPIMKLHQEKPRFCGRKTIPAFWPIRHYGFKTGRQTVGPQ
jgi:hypothetical protein